MADIQGNRDLRAWQAGMLLAEETDPLTSKSPDRELHGLTSSIRRAAVQRPPIIARGHTLEATKDYLFHLNRVRTHLADVPTQVELAGRFGYLAAEQVDRARDRTVSLAKQ